MLALGVERIGSDHGVGQVQASSSGRNWVISLVWPSIRAWPRTPRLVWSITASRWTWGLGWWPLPRRVLPSTATARCGRVVDAAGGRVAGRGGCWPASQAPIARSSSSGSMRATTRRTVASPGGLKAPVNGSRGIPRQARPGRARRWPTRQWRPGTWHRPAPRRPRRRARRPACAVGLAGGGGR